MPETTIAPAVETPAAPKIGLAGLSEMLATAGKTPVDTPSPVAAKAVVAPVIPEVKAPEVNTPEIKAPITPEKPAVDEVEEFRKSASPKTQNRFNVMLEEAKRREIEKLQQEGQLITPEFKEKLTAAEQRAQAYEMELKQVAIERSPEYRAQFVDKPKQLEEQLRKMAAVHEIDENDLISAIRGGEKTERHLDTILGSMGIIGSQKVAKLAVELQDLEAKKALVLADSELAIKTLNEKRVNETKTAVERLVNARSEVLKNEVMPEILETYKAAFEGEGAALKSTVLDFVEKLNTWDMEAMVPKDRATMAFCACLAQPLLKQVQSRDAAIAEHVARIAELEEKLSAQDNATPKVGGRANSNGAKEEAPVSTFQRMRQDLTTTSR